MLFMYTNTHTPERCLVGKPQELLRIYSGVKERFAQKGIKVHGAYGCAFEHTFFFILEADDLQALSSALIPLTEWGVGRLTPVSELSMMVG